MARDTLTVIDNRTGKRYELPISYGTYPMCGASIRAMDLRQIRVDDHDFGLLAYDPGLKNTQSASSAITFVDGEQGILRYRGYPIEQLAEHSNYLEVAYLLFFGELPTKAQFERWTQAVVDTYPVHENLKKLMDCFWYDANAMGVFIGALGTRSTFNPEAKDVVSPEQRVRQATKILASMPTVAAYTYRHSRGLPYVYPDRSLPFVRNFLAMLFHLCPECERVYGNPVIERALEVLFILHADHEQNCSTTTMRTVGSSHADPYSAMAAAAAALGGQLHGGENLETIEMLQQIGTVENIPPYIERVKRKQVRLMGFGHRVYKNYDPRATIIKRMADDVLGVTEPDPLLDVAKKLEETALQDEYFVERNLYPNVNFYSGIIYKAIGFPVDMFPVLFALSRTAGWLAHWLEHLDSQDQRIVRPRQQYTGPDKRDFLPIERRG